MKSCREKSGSLRHSQLRRKATTHKRRNIQKIHSKSRLLHKNERGQSFFKKWSNRATFPSRIRIPSFSRMWHKIHHQMLHGAKIYDPFGEFSPDIRKLSDFQKIASPHSKSAFPSTYHSLCAAAAFLSRPHMTISGRRFSINPFLQRYEELTQKKPQKSTPPTKQAISSKRSDIDSHVKSPSHTHPSPPSDNRRPQASRPENPPPPPRQRPPADKARPVCSPSDANYLKSTLYRPLGQMWKLSQHIPRHDDFRCTGITTETFAERSIYTFSPTSSLSTLPRLSIQYSEHLQPQFHSNTFCLRLPQPTHYHAVSLDAVSTSYSFHRFALLQDISTRLITAAFSQHHPEGGNSQLLIDVPFTDIRNNPIALSYSSPIHDDYANGVSSILQTLQKLCVDKSFFSFLFQQEIVVMVPFERNADSIAAQRRRAVNVHVDSGETIDLNEGVEDPELVNTVIAEFGFDPQNLTQHQFDQVYQAVESRLQHSFSSQAIYSEDEEVNEMSSHEDDDGADDIIASEDDSAIAKAQDDVIQAQMGNPERSDHRRSKYNLLKGDEGDIMDPDAEIYPQDKRLYHGALSKEAIRAIELSELQDQQLDNAAASSASSNSDESSSPSHPSKIHHRNNNNKPSFSEWKFHGGLYSELAQSVHHPTSNQIDPSETVQNHLRINILQQLTADEAYDHFRLQFSSLFQDKASYDRLSHPEADTLNQNFDHLGTPIQLSCGGPDVQLAAIMDTITSVGFDKLAHVVDIPKLAQKQKQFFSLSSCDRPSFRATPSRDGEVLVAQLVDDNDTASHGTDSVVPSLSYPIIRHDMPFAGPYSAVTTTVQFHNNLSFNTNPSSISGSSSSSALLPITNFMSPTRFSPSLFDPMSLERHEALFSLHVDTIGDAQVEEPSHIHPDLNAQVEQDKLQWLKSCLVQKQQLFLPNFSVSDHLRHQLRLLTIPSTPFASSKAFSNFDYARGIMCHPDQPPSASVPLIQQFSHETKDVQTTVNTLLEHIALIVSLRLVQQKYNNSSTAADQQVTMRCATSPPRTILQLEEEPSESYFKSQIEFHLTANLQHAHQQPSPDEARFDALDAASSATKKFFTFIRSLMTSHHSSIFSHETIIPQLVQIHEELSAASANPHPNENFAHLILAKKYLPLLIFGNSPEQELSPTVVAFMSMHFDTVFKRHISSNNQRRFCIRPIVAQNSSTGSQVTFDERITQIMNSLAPSSQPDLVLPSSSGEPEQSASTSSSASNLEGGADAPESTSRKLLKTYNELLRWQRKQMELASSRAPLLPRAITFPAQRIFDTPNTLTSLHHRVTQPQHLTLHHTIGGQIYIPVSSRYNINPERSDQHPGVNLKRDYEAKWLSTAILADKSAAERSPQARILERLQHDGHVDKVIVSSLVSSLHLRKLSQDYHKLTQQQQSISNPQELEHLRSDIQACMLPMLPIPTPEQPHIASSLLDIDHMHENVLNMSFTKAQQRACPSGQLLLPISKHLARPLHITIDDTPGNFVHLDVLIDNVAQRLTPYQITLLPLLQHIFGKQSCSSDLQSQSSHQDRLDALGMQVKMSFGYALSDDQTIANNNQHDFSSSQPDPKVPSALAQSHLRCVISTQCHVNNIEAICDMLINMLTTVDLTDDIAALFSSFGQTMTSSSLSSIAPPSSGATDRQQQNTLSHSNKMSFFHSANRVVANTTLSTNNPWGSFAEVAAANSTPAAQQPISDVLPMSPFFFNATCGLQQQQHLPSMLQRMFQELQGISPNDDQGRYASKLRQLPPEWQSALAGTSAADSSASPSSIISPMMMLITNDLAETLKCLLLGPVENQFVHSSLIEPNSPSSLAHDTVQDNSSRHHTNLCNNNYYSLNRFEVDPATIQSDPNAPTTAYLTHPLQSPIQPNTSIPLPPVIPHKKHTADPTYPNIYSNPQLSGHLACTQFGLSSIHIRTNKHTLLQPEYTAMLTAGTASLVNLSLISRLTSFPPESSLLACYLHQPEFDKHVIAQQLTSTSITSSPSTTKTHPAHIIHHSTSSLDSLPLQSTRVVPLTSVRNIYTQQTLTAAGTDTLSVLSGQNPILRVSYHGNVSYDAPEIVARADSVQEDAEAAVYHDYQERLIDYQRYISQYHQHKQSLSLQDQAELAPPLAPPSPPDSNLRLTSHISAQDWLRTQFFDQMHSQEQGRLSSKNSSHSKSQQQLRPNHYVAVGVAQSSTTISFPAVSYTKALQSRHEALRFGIILLAKHCLDHILATGSANLLHSSLGQVNHNQSTMQQTPVQAFLQDCAIKMRSSPQNFNVQVVIDPVTGIFAFQHQAPSNTQQADTSPQSGIAGQSAASDNAVPDDVPSSSPSSVTTRQAQRLGQHSQSHYIVEMLRQICTSFVEDNATNGNTGSALQPTKHGEEMNPNASSISSPFVLDDETFRGIKLRLLTHLLQHNIDAPLTSQPRDCIQTGAFASSSDLSNVSPVTGFSHLPPNVPPAIINIIKEASVNNVSQVLREICHFSTHAKVTTVGPIEDIPDVIEADAKTSNGTWALLVL